MPGTSRILNLLPLRLDSCDATPNNHTHLLLSILIYLPVYSLSQNVLEWIPRLGKLSTIDCQFDESGRYL